jgi:hypothetical protein
MANDSCQLLTNVMQAGSADNVGATGLYLAVAGSPDDGIIG